MSAGKHLLVTCFVFLCACRYVSAYEVDFSELSYSGGLPVGWSLEGTEKSRVGLPSSQPQTPVGTEEAGLCVNFYNATKQNVLYSTNFYESIACDTLLATLRICAKRGSDLVDKFQVVVSTNDWSSYMPIGDPIEIVDSEWTTYSRSATFAGLEDMKPNLRIGVCFLQAGQSKSYGYIRSLNVLSGATAAPKEVSLLRNGMCVDSNNPLVPGDDDIGMSVKVSPDPKDARLQIEGVYGVVERGGIVTTNRLVNVEGTDKYTNSVIGVKLDAGEELRVSAYTKYTVAQGLPTAGVYNPGDGYVYEELDSADVCRCTVSKSGSVWINELFSERLEICGTTNRVISSGWALVVYTSEGEEICRANLGDAFDFTTNMINGVVGLDVRELSWEGGALPTDSATYYVSLCNSRGVAEHTVDMTFSGFVVRGMVGYAKWPNDGYAYDWSGTATDNTFVWDDLAEASFGTVNVDQGFNVPVSVVLTVNTLISYATIVASVSNLDNTATLGTVTNFTATSKDGVASFKIAGCTPFTNDIHYTLSGTAFGWTCDDRGGVLTNGCPQASSLVFIPSVAFDDFSKASGYWDWNGQEGKLKWEIVTVSRDGNTDNVLSLKTYSASSGRGKLKCLNYLCANGHKVCSVEFDYLNTKIDSYADDEFSVCIGTNANFTGVVALTSPLSNKRDEYGNGKWYRYGSVFDLPAGFEDAPELWLELLCVSKYNTHTYTRVDNLRIAFQDVAMPTNLVRAVDEVVSGQSSDFAVDVVPQATEAVSNVTAQLNFTLNGVTTNVPFAFDGAAVTNLDGVATAVVSADTLKAVMGDLTGLPERPFLTGDQVSYYATVNYYSDNGDTDVAKRWENRYYPDNHKDVMVGDVEHWVVEGTGTDPYKPVATNFTVSGDAVSVATTPMATADGVKFLVHAYTNDANIAKIKVTVGGTDYVLYEGVATNRVTQVFKLETGLDASTDYTVTVTALDAGGNVIATSTEATFTTKPMTAEASITGVSSTAVKLTAVGAAAGYVLDPDDWGTGTQVDVHTWTWTRNDGTPNSEFTVTVTATNKLGEASEPVTTNGYTLAAVATKAPVIAKDESKTKIVAKADAAETLNGNPDWTEYALAISNGVNEVVATTNGVAVWRTLADWKTEPVTFSEGIELTATNYFRFVTRNKVGELNYSKASTNCTFDLTAEIKAAAQVADPYGYVAITNLFFDPARSNSTAALEYKIGDAAWQSLKSDAEIVFGANYTVTTNFLWDAWTAVGKVNGEYTYVVRAKITNKGSARASEWAESASGTLDFVKPTATLTCPTLSPFGTASVPMVVTVTFDKVVAGLSAEHFTIVNGDVVFETVSEKVYKLTITPKAEGAVSVQLKADQVADAFGNKNAASETLSRTYHTTPPAWNDPAITGAPAEGAVTNGTTCTITVSASDTVAPVTYMWKTNDAEVAGQTTATYEFTGREGTNTVTIFAYDGLDNKSVPTNRTWVIDTIAPTLPAISGTPAKDAITKVAAYDLTASAEDATKVAYHWVLYRSDEDVASPTGGDVASQTGGAKFSGTAEADGVYTAKVFATDEAGNVSATNVWKWTLDTHAPTNVVIHGVPEEAVVTNGVDFSFSATALDATAVKYYWTTNGVKIVEASPTCAGKGVEGTNTVSVYAVDAAGNQSVATNRIWVIDTKAPTKPTITGVPTSSGAITNIVAYNLTASAEDQTKVEYYWALYRSDGDVASPTGGDVASPTAGAQFEGTVAKDGVYTAKVYAVDEAGNVSATNDWNWTVDTVAPSVTNLTSTTPDPFGKGTQYLEVTVMFNEPVVGFAAASVSVDNKATVASIEPIAGTDNASYKVKINPGDDGKISVQVKAGVVKDRAGNANLASAVLTRVYDTTPPADFKLTGKPAANVVTNSVAFDFTASAQDTTTLTYHWKTNDVLVADNVSSHFAGTVSEGTNTLVVSVEDALGNPCEPITNKWVVDTFAPTNLAVVGYPPNGAYTNLTAVNLTASALDATRLTYYWTLRGSDGDVASPTTGAQFSKVVEADGVYTAMVYAVDEANNKSATTNWTWTVDTVRPSVTLTTDAPTTFNKFRMPFNVTVTFSEEVANFTKNCVTIENGSVTNVTGSGAVYTLYIDPREETDSETFVLVTVKIAENAVRDFAGNGNTTSASLTRRNVTKMPTVTLSSDTPACFSAANLPFKVKATFVRGKNAEPAFVTNFTAASVSVVNGTVTDVSPLYNPPVGPAAATNIYTFTVVPAAEGEITVSIPASVVVDVAGNANEASDPLKRMYDKSAPAWNDPAIVGTPANGTATNGTHYALAAQAADATAITYHWSLHGSDGDVASPTTGATFEGDVAKEGAYTVKVYATDAAGNVSTTNIWSWTYDKTAPAWTTPAITGTPADGSATNGKAYDLTAHAEDATAITYHWTLRGSDGDVASPTTGAQFAGAVEADGVYTAMVYAVDAAGNVSTTNTWSWTYDKTAPAWATPAITGTPADGSATNGSHYAFAAQATDNLTAITYHWSLHGSDGDVASPTTGATFEGDVAKEGVYTVKVYATDVAGNVSTTNSWTWTYDKSAPAWATPAIMGTPAFGSVTNGAHYALAAQATDATAITYHWSLHGSDGDVASPTTGATFEGDVAAEGVYTVKVYATDAAGNVSTTNTWNWTYDKSAPVWENPAITGTPANGTATNGTHYALAAHATDNLTAIAYHWTIDDGANWTAGATFEGDVSAEQPYTVKVYATDAAGNASATNSWSWTYDKTEPQNLSVAGLPIGTDPAKLTVTNGFDFALTAQSEDKTAVTYQWKTNGVDVTDCSTSSFIGMVGEGTNTVTVAATDAAGNACAPIACRWVVDTIRPSNPVITGSPVDGSISGVPTFSYVAEASDATILTYTWTLDKGTPRTLAPGVAFEGSKLKDGQHTVEVYATDEAGNVSVTNVLTWTVALPKLIVTGISTEKVYGTEQVATDVQYIQSVMARDYNGGLTPVTEGWTGIDVAFTNAQGVVAYPTNATAFVGTYGIVLSNIRGLDMSLYASTVSYESGIFSVTQAPLTITVQDVTWRVGRARPANGIVDFSAQLKAGDKMADVTGRDFAYVYAKWGSSVPTGHDVGVYPKEIGLDLSSLKGARVSNYCVSVKRGTMTVIEALPNAVCDRKQADETTPQRTSATQYDGVIYEGDSIVGTVAISLSKANRKTGLAKVTAKFTPLKGTKIIVKGQIDPNAGVSVLTAKDGRELKLTFGDDGVYGTFGTWDIECARNLYSSRDASDKALVKSADRWMNTYALAFAKLGCWGSLSVKVTQKGKAKISGALANGRKISASAQMIIGCDGCCLPIVFSKSYASFACCIWFTDEGIEVTDLAGAKIGTVSNLVGANTLALNVGVVESLVGFDGATVLTEYVPDGVEIALDARQKWIVMPDENGVAMKAGNLVWDKKAGAVDLEKSKIIGYNVSGLKLTYKSATGVFKGSFKAYALVKGSLKKRSVTINGIVVDGVGYGSAAYKKIGGAELIIQND